MNILEMILKFLARIFETFKKSKELNIVKIDKTIKQKYSFPRNAIALIKAEKFLMKNSYAYLRGKDEWQAGRIGGKNYNNILYCFDGEKYFKVYRLFDSGTIYYIEKEEISQGKFESLKGYFNTYCNFAINIFWNYFIYNKEISNNNLQYFDEHEVSANKQIEYFKKGKFVDTKCEFKEVNREDAINIAINRGLVFATLDAKIGHVATLTGNLVNNEPEICQAGLYFGIMKESKGFGKDNVSKIKYYAWTKKDELDIEQS